MKKSLLSLFICVLTLSLNNLSALGPNDSKAMALGFKDEGAVLNFGDRVEKYGMAMNYLKAIVDGSARDFGVFTPEEVQKVKAFFRENSEFDKKLKKFCSNVSETHGLTILGYAITKSYQLGLRGGPDTAFRDEASNASLEYPMHMIRTFKQTYESMIDKSEEILNSLNKKQ